MGSRLLGRVGSGRVFFESGRVMDFAHPYLFSFMDHLCQYLDYGPYFNTNRETQTPPSPSEVYYKLHYNAKKGWLNDEAKSEHFLLLIIHAAVNDFEPPIIVVVLVLI
ncbi:hypothetical protein Hanom_Chr00s000001g01592391 [Helianthus anomalus]